MAAALRAVAAARSTAATGLRRMSSIFSGFNPPPPANPPPKADPSTNLFVSVIWMLARQHHDAGSAHSGASGND